MSTLFLFFDGLAPVSFLGFSLSDIYSVAKSETKLSKLEVENLDSSANATSPIASPIGFAGDLILFQNQFDEFTLPG